MGKHIWLWVSLTHESSKKKKVKVPFNSDEEDYDAAFESLKKSCTTLLSKHITANESPELRLELAYVGEDQLKDGDIIELSEPDDFEGMLEEYDGGRGCRILIKTQEFEDKSIFAPSTIDSRSKVAHYLANQMNTPSRSTSVESKPSRSSSPAGRFKQMSGPKNATSKTPLNRSCPEAKVPKSEQHAEKEITPDKAPIVDIPKGPLVDIPKGPIVDIPNEPSSSFSPQTGSLTDCSVRDTDFSGQDGQQSSSDLISSNDSALQIQTMSDFPQVPEDDCRPTKEVDPEQDMQDESFVVIKEDDKWDIKEPVTDNILRLVLDSKEDESPAVTPMEYKPTIESGGFQYYSPGEGGLGVDQVVLSLDDSTSVTADTLGEPETLEREEIDEEMMEVDGTDGREEEMLGHGNDMPTSPVKREVEEDDTSESLSVIKIPEDNATENNDVRDKEADDNTVDGVGRVTLDRSNQKGDKKEPSDDENASPNSHETNITDEDKADNDPPKENPEEASPSNDITIDLTADKRVEMLSIHLNKETNSEQFGPVPSDGPSAVVQSGSLYSDKLKPRNISSNNGMFGGAFNKVKTFIKDKVTPGSKNISLTFIVHASIRKDEHMSMRYSFGGTKNMKDTELEKVYAFRGTSYAIYSITLKNIPTDVDVYYKFLKYSIFSNGSVYTTWESLDATHHRADNFINRRTALSTESKTIYAAVKFQNYVGDQEQFNQYSDLLRFLRDQNPSRRDFCKQMTQFIEDTVMEIPKCQALLRKNLDYFLDCDTLEKLLTLLWILAVFEKQTKDNAQRKTLTNLPKSLKKCCKILLRLTRIQFDLDICREVVTRLEKLITTYSEECPELIIPYFAQTKRLKELGGTPNTFMGEDRDDFDMYFMRGDMMGMEDMMGMGPMMRHGFNAPRRRLPRLSFDADFFKEFWNELLQVDDLLDVCMESADLEAMAYLINDKVKQNKCSLEVVLDSVSTWTVEKVAPKDVKEKEVKEKCKSVCRHIRDRLRTGDFTEKIERATSKWAESISRTTSRKRFEEERSFRPMTYRSREMTDFSNEPWFRISTTLFSGLWQCYFMSTLNWKKSIQNTHVSYLHYQNIEWWVRVFRNIEQFAQGKENIDEAEKHFLSLFRNYLAQKKAKEKQDLINSETFMDSDVYPYKMINTMIESLQSFIINFLQDAGIFNKTRGFVKALKEILKRKFPAGPNFRHLLESDPEKPNHFPWESIFEMSDFKDCPAVMEAKALLRNTLHQIKSREITLKLLQTLLAENGQINPRFRQLTSKVHKTNKEDVKDAFVDVATEFEQFQLILQNCRYLIESYFKNHGKTNHRDIGTDLKDFLNQKLKDIWYIGGPGQPQFMVHQQKCFRNLTEVQIGIIRSVKIVDGTKLYRDIIAQNFNKIPLEELNTDDILGDLVAKAFEPTHKTLVAYYRTIHSEEIKQSEVKKRFGPQVPGYETYREVRVDLLNLGEALKRDRIRERTFTKLEIILSDLKSAFKCMDSLKNTLGITSQWNDVEKLRKTVCKENFDEPLSVINSDLDLKFFFKIRDTKTLVNGFANSQELLVWIKEIARDEKDIATFIDLAETVEDAARSDRLSGLQQIIRAIRPLVFNVKSDDNFDRFRDAFEDMYKMVQGDEQITAKLKDVTDNLKWFKEIQDLQTDTTKSSISQVEELKKYGHFIVGCNDPVSDFFEERKIEDLMKAEIIYQSGETKHMMYKDLKELNDKLVLIRVQQDHRTKVNNFNQVFLKLSQICETYKKLNECGHDNYQTWQINIGYRDPEAKLEEVNKLYSKMVKELEEVRQHIEEKIREYEPLTNFTQRQLLFLRSRLARNSAENLPPSYYLEPLMLLQAINSRISEEELRRLIQTSHNGNPLLSMDELGKVLTSLYIKPRYEDCSILVRNEFQYGRPNLIKISARDIFRCVLSLFKAIDRAPTAEEILCCTPDTTAEQISVFLRRAIFTNNNQQVNCLVSPEKLTYQLNKHFIDEYERLSQKSMSTHCKYMLVVITVENVGSEIASTFVAQTRQFPLADANVIKQFATRTILSDANCVCDPDRMSGRLVQSEGSGNGKTHKVQLILDKYSEQYSLCSVPIHKRTCDRNMILKEFLGHEKKVLKKTIFLVDVSPSVREGVEMLIFELLILRKLTDRAGRVFRPLKGEYIVIEGLFSSPDFTRHFPIEFASFLPNYDCLSPRKALGIYKNDEKIKQNQILLEKKQFESDKWQRAYQYLHAYRQTNGTMAGFNFDCNRKNVGADHEQRCVDIFLETFYNVVEIEDPSWRELNNFVCFLNTQLMCYERSYFTNTALAPDLGIQFNAFVVKFMIKMSEEFATRSLKISEGAGVLAEHELQKHWNKTFHPYLFFNNDGMSFTFIGFRIQAPGDLVDVVTNEVKVRNFMGQDLLGRLRGQHVTFKEELKDYTSEKLMEKLSSVLDLRPGSVIPATDYQLTLDNTIKILAIHMRMRANIPVVIMGETGCGKTALIEFMCDIIKQSVLSGVQDPDKRDRVNNLILLRVHGGITSKIIAKTIRDAEEQAQVNCGVDSRFETIVFFDEANATSEIDLIREIMCNHTINGRKINSSIRFIAAVNPYRKHTPEMISLLKKAGLGYRTADSEVFDKIGEIPLRELVYRVQPLPPSLKPLIWDFGAMDNETEKRYIKLMIESSEATASVNEGFRGGLVTVISGCQDILRKKSDQCSFVSLRDVNRFIEVFEWFLKMNTIFSDRAEEQNNTDFNRNNYNSVVVATINAIGVCYYVRVSDRDDYLEQVATYFSDPFPTVTGAQLGQEISATQKVLLYEMLHKSGVSFSESIAENGALRENVFMMVVCIELGIPLFIVGSPGSSKSLAKLIVKSCLSGDNSKSPLFEHLCQIHMISFQCSQQSEAEGIERTFSAARRYISQNANHTNRRVVPVVVLDEIGLAEDSKKMPLKALHSLLEDDGKSGDVKVGFIGISNWSLDPAKMNRGLYVTRQLPKADELKETALEIFSNDTKPPDDRVKQWIVNVTKIYEEVYAEFCETDTKSYIGLRDFYCLIKYLRRKYQDRGGRLTLGDIQSGILRNFGGINEEANKRVEESYSKHFEVKEGMWSTKIDMIRENLTMPSLQSGSRYLLIVTPNLETTIDTLHKELIRTYDKVAKRDGRQPQIKFNSDFPDDADYTKRCKIINEVKNSIEKGDDILLIDMEMIYESLYDVLNQYYKTWQGKKYVEIALESNRVNCRVHDKTKIILLARPDQAQKFPIPLLNRMEKHYFTLRESMSLVEKQIAASLDDWVKQLTTSDSDELDGFDVNECFIGFHQDTTASYLTTEWTKMKKKRNLHANHQLKDNLDYAPHLEENCKKNLLKTVSYDGLVRFIASNCREYKQVWDMYYGKNEDSPWRILGDLKSFLTHLNKSKDSSFYVVSTYSHLPAKKNIPLPKDASTFKFNVEEFGSQDKFEKAVDPFISCTAAKKWLVILVPTKWLKLLSYIRFHLQSKGGKSFENQIQHVVIVTQLHRNASERPALFHSDVWDNVHIENLMTSSSAALFNLEKLFDHDIPTLFKHNILDMNTIVTEHENRVICRISNPFPHQELGSVLKRCLESELVLDKIREMLEKRDTQNWVTNAALNKNQLSENTSFQNVLLLRVAEEVTFVAASIVADIDRDGNMALRSNEILTDFFDQMAGFVQDWSEVQEGKFTVCKIQHNFLASDQANQSNQFPFSWIVKERIDRIGPGALRISPEDDFLEDTMKVFLDEMMQSTLYDVVKIASETENLRDILKDAYLADYLNMVYGSQSELEFKIAQQIFQVSLPDGWQDMDIAEFAVLVYIVYHRSVKQQLSALEDSLTVFTEEVTSDLTCFSDVREAEVPLFDLGMIILAQIGQSTNMVTKSSNFTRVVRQLINIHEHADFYNHRVQLMEAWDKVRFKSLYIDFINKLTKATLTPPNVAHDFYEKIVQKVDESTVQESLTAITTNLYNLIVESVAKQDMDVQLMRKLWYCENCRKPTEEQYLTTCLHVLCTTCYTTLPNMTCFCQHVLFEDAPDIPLEYRPLVEYMKSSSEEAVNFLSRVVVTFLGDEKLSEDILHKLTTIGMGRVVENKLFKPVSSATLEAFQTLIFTMFIRNKSIYPFDNYKKYIAELCLINADEFCAKKMAKFVSICQIQHMVGMEDDVGALVRHYTALSDQHNAEQYIDQTLDTVAYLRQLLVELVPEVVKVLEGAPLSPVLQRLRAALEHARPSEVYTLKLFFLKQMLLDQGVTVVKKITEDANLSWISPVKETAAAESDLFVILGPGYLELRNALAKHSEDQLTAIQDLFDEGELKPLQAVAAACYVHSNTPILDATRNKVHENLRDQSARDCLVTITGPEQVLAGVDLALTRQFKAPLLLLYIALHTSCRHPFLRLLQSIRLHPEQSTSKYLPGMRDNNLADFIGNLGEGNSKWKWYKCTAGHAYAINNCGRPMQRARCGCGAEIGGENHRFTNTGTDNSELTNANALGLEEKGYNLVPADVRPLTDTERNLSPLLLNIVRWFMHAGFLLSPSLAQYKDLIFKIGQRDPVEFLLHNMNRDLDGMRQQLNTGPDGCILFLMRIVMALTKSTENVNINCAQKPERARVEGSLVVAIQDLLQNPLGVIRSAQVLVVADINVVTNPLIKQLYEFEDPPKDLSSDEVHCKSELWRNSQALNMQLFASSFNNSLRPSEQARYPTVRTFLQISDQIHLLGLLPKILKFFRQLLSQFSYKISREEARARTIQDVIQDNPDLQEGWRAWALAWREIDSSSTKYAIPEQYRDKKIIDATEPLSLFLPEPVAREGICCLHLLDSLISLHNKLVKAKRSGLKEIELSERALFVSYDEKRTNMFMLYSHSIRLVGKVKEVSFHYDLFEQYLRDEVLGGVHPIRESMKDFTDSDTFKMTYQEDVTWLDLCQKLDEKEKQVRIPTKDKIEFADLGTASRAKKALATAIGYIRNGLGTGEGTENLVMFMERIGCFKDEPSSCIPSSLKKCHVLDAWYSAYFYQSYRSTSLPFDSVKQEELPPEVATWLQDMKTLKIVKKWLMELHRFLIEWVVLKPQVGTDGMDFSGMGLMDCLDFFWDYGGLNSTLLRLLEDEKRELDEAPLPDELLYEHAFAFWLELKDKHQRIG